MKKILLVTIMFLLFAGVVSASSINGDYKGNPIVKLKSNGSLVDIGEVPAMIYDGKTMVPIAALRNLGADVTWDQNEYSVDVKLPNVNLSTPKKITLEEIFDELGPNGDNAVAFVTRGIFSHLTQIEFYLTFNPGDEGKSSAYQKVLQRGVDFGADQIKIETYSQIIFIPTVSYDKFIKKEISSEDYNQTVIIQSKIGTPVNTPVTTPTEKPIAKNSLKLYSNDGKTYLGKITADEYDSDSIYNEYGTYGSKYSTESIWNEFGDYGSKYSSKSAFNDLATEPPIILDGKRNIVAYLTTNTTIKEAVSPIGLKEFLVDNGY